MVKCEMGALFPVAQKKPTPETKNTVIQRKLTVVGDICGKTTLVQTYIKDECSQATTSYVSSDITDVEANGQVVCSIIFDTCGQHRLTEARKYAYNETNVVLICFSVYDHWQFDNVKLFWIPEMKKFAPKNVPFILVGTHCNSTVTERKKRIQIGKIADLVDEVGAMGYVECCSYKKYNVDEVFETAVSVTM